MDRGDYTQRNRSFERDGSNADLTFPNDFSNDDTAFYQMIDEIATRRKPSLAGAHRNNSLRASSQPMDQKDSLISRLPPELMILIFGFLPKKSDLISALLVCKQWADLCVDLIWFRPAIANEDIKAKFTEVMKTPAHQTYWDYRPLIKRLNLSLVSSTIDDKFVDLFQGSVNLERTTLVNCTRLSSTSVSNLLHGCSKLQSIDLSGVKCIDDNIYRSLTESCPRLQGFYAPGSRHVTKAAVLALVSHCPMLKRIRFSECYALDDEVMEALVTNCPNIVELDLQGCSKITDASLSLAFLKLEQLREFKISQNGNITYECFKLLTEEHSLEKLRVVDFTSCELVGDKAVERLVKIAPRLRNVGLSKCAHISDTAMRHLATLGKFLHWIHLGHCSNITDYGAIALIRNCHRLQYVDFACCSQLTNDTLFELAQLPRLRRIGLVKCVNISDLGIEALAESRNQHEDTLERVHLSYCTQIGIYPVYKLLLACPKLTHLSLSGISAFLRSDITRFCRHPPSEFSENQKTLFCVFSGKGVDLLRNYLHDVFTELITQHNNGLGRIPMMRDDSGMGVNGLIWAIDSRIPGVPVRQPQAQLQQVPAAVLQLQQLQQLQAQLNTTRNAFAQDNTGPAARPAGDFVSPRQQADQLLQQRQRANTAGTPGVPVPPQSFVPSVFMEAYLRETAALNGNNDFQAVDAAGQANGDSSDDEMADE